MELRDLLPPSLPSLFWNGGYFVYRDPDLTLEVPLKGRPSPERRNFLTGERVLFTLQKVDSLYAWTSPRLEVVSRRSNFRKLL